jgi:hypothetical protein
MFSGDCDSLRSAILTVPSLYLNSEDAPTGLMLSSVLIKVSIERGWVPLRAFSVHVGPCRGHTLKLTNAVVDHGSCGKVWKM